MCVCVCACVCCVCVHVFLFVGVRVYGCVGRDGRWAGLGWVGKWAGEWVDEWVGGGGGWLGALGLGRNPKHELLKRGPAPSA